ncbi:MAG TPA: hypothetical protein VNI54_01615 [Thermoanaerobaculia bacterium]|nr:hypothetical protein [Thermoanaerobaculia bacterium]
MSASIAVDLQSINLDGILAARGKISGVLADEKVKKLLAGDGIEAILGSLGGAVASLQSTGGAGALLQPIVDAVGKLDIDVDAALPIADYVQAVTEGATLVARFLGTLKLDPQSIGKLLPLDQLTRTVDSFTAGYRLSDGAGTFRAMVNQVEGGLPSNPKELANITAGILLPFGGNGVLSLRAGIDDIFSASGAIHLPKGRTEGLVLALKGVELAAGDSAKLEAALANLERVRVSTIGVLRNDIAVMRDAVRRLRLADALAPIVELANALPSGQSGFLELLDELREFLIDGRQLVENLDIVELREFVQRLVVLAEEQVRAQIEQPIDDAVRAAEEFVSGLFAHLPLREYRARLTAFLAAVAEKVEALDLDGPADAIHEKLSTLDDAIDPAKLTAEVQALLADVKAAIENVVNTVKGALQEAVNAIQAIEAKLKEVFDRVVSVLAQFSEAMGSLTAAIESLGIEDATDQVIAAIREVRVQAEELLTSAELPEPLKPIVQEAIDALQGLDFDSAFAPVRDVVAQVKIPDSVKSQITSVLKDVQAKLENAVPEQLIASIDAEVGQVFGAIRAFDPANLLEGVSRYLDEAADMIESLDVAKAAQAIRGPFEAVLGVLDAISPRKLLAPVIDAYQSLLGGAAAPSPDDAAAGFGAAISGTGTAATQPLLQPAAQAGGTPNAELKEEPPSSTPDLGIKIKPGDAIRFLGYLPNKLREALGKLPQTAVGEVMTAIDGVTGGLARDLRRVRARVLDLGQQIENDLDVELLPVANASVSAQAALELKPAPGVELSVSFAALATVSPGALRDELQASLDDMSDGIGAEANVLAGEVAVALDQAATVLEAVRLSNVTDSADGLLAALDPEPIAAELDALAAAALKKAAQFLGEFDDELLAALMKIKQLFDDLNPATQAQKFLRLVDVIRRELDVLDPALLADELGAIHAAVRNALMAYDPLAFAADLQAPIKKVADGLRGLKAQLPAIFGDLGFLEPLLATLDEVNPATILSEVGASLKDVGAELAKLDPSALLVTVDGLAERIRESFQRAVDAIVEELIALLESLRYAAGGGSVQLEIQVTI